MSSDHGESSSEVDDLLRAAEDHLLLNLRLNSHPKSRPLPSSTSSLDSDLSRRFEALKTHPKSQLNSNPNPNPNPSSRSPEPTQSDLKKGVSADEESSGILGDDLAARFAALKGSPAPPLPPDQDLDRAKITEDNDDDDDEDKYFDEVSKKEVEKLMQWAKDAARLDPSSKSDDEEDAHDDDDDDESDDDSDDEVERKKRKEKNKGKPKRFFFF